MLKGTDLYWIYEMRPIVERTEDEFYKKMADDYANYINLNGSFIACEIKFKEDEKVFSIYSGDASSSSEVASLVPVKCEDGICRWYFEMQTLLLEIDVLLLVNTLYNAIKTMEKQRS